VATIDMRPDNIVTGVRWLVWTEREEIVGRIDRVSTDRCKLTPQGPHWSPLKNFDQPYSDFDTVLDEVRHYFQGR
jgi:hypothetical protein